MYGGFSFHLHSHGRDHRLVSDSWSRVVGGSEHRHEITTADATRRPLPGAEQPTFQIVSDPSDA
jgi:hypothetical protein